MGKKVMRQINLFVVLNSLYFLSNSCASRSEQATLKGDLFRVHKRLLQIEQKLDVTLSQNKDAGTQASRSLANSSIKLDQIDKELRLMQGDVDTLRRGVITGEMPGMETQTDSVAKSIQLLVERVGGLEKTQLDILAMLEKKAGSKKKKRASLDSLQDVEKAFNTKRYLYITQDVPKLLRKNAKDKLTLEKLNYVYARALFKVGRLRDSVLVFNDLLENSSLEAKLPHINLRIADAFRLLGDSKAASLYYSEVVKKFPSSAEAEEAGERVQSLEKNT